MPKKAKKTRLKVVFLPILLGVFFITLLITHYLKIETTSPSEGWSRSISLPMKSGNMPPFYRREEKGYSIYAPYQGKVEKIVLDDTLQVKEKAALPVSIPEQQSYWAKGNQAVYLKDGKVRFFNGQEDKTLANEADGLAANANHILFWSEQKIYSIEPNMFQISTIAEEKQKIKSVILSEGSTSFLAVSAADKTTLEITFYQKKADQSYQSTYLFQKQEYPEEKLTFNFVENKTDLSILYTHYVIRQGQRIYTHYLTSMPLNQLKRNPSFQTLTVFSDESNTPLKNMNYVQLVIRDNTPSILFSAEGRLTAKRNAVNIYEAKQVNDSWLAKRLSTTDAVSIQPFSLDDQSVLWLDFAAIGQYSLTGTTKDPAQVARSLELSSDDWINAVSNTLTSLIYSLFSLFIAMLWIVPFVIFILVVHLTAGSQLTKDATWIKWTGIALYLVTQLLFIGKIYNDAFYNTAPSYLTFRGSFIAIPLLLAGLTWMVAKYGENKEWGVIGETFYYIGVNVWIVFLLLGPYMLT